MCYRPVLAQAGMPASGFAPHGAAARVVTLTPTRASLCIDAAN